MGIKEDVFRLITAAIPRKYLYKVGKRLLDRASGDNNDNMLINGEKNLLNTILSSYKGKQVTFFDIGANVGMWTIMFLVVAERNRTNKLNGHCFEPSRYTFNKLQENLKANSSASCIVPHNIAVSCDQKSLLLYINREGAGTNSVYERQGFVNISQESVSATTIDIFCEKNQITTIDFLKIDVEGHELNVLKGARKMLEIKKIKYIQFEYGGCWIDSHTLLLDVFTCFSEFGYKIGKILPGGLEIYDKYSSRLDTFQMANFLAYLPEKEGLFRKHSLCWDT